MARLRVPPRAAPVLVWPDEKHPTVARLCQHCKRSRRPGERWRQACPACQPTTNRRQDRDHEEGMVSGHG